MGFFDALFGGNTNHALDQATSAANGLTASTQQQNANALYAGANNATSALNTGAQGALSSLLAGYGAGRDALTSYGGQALGALNGGVDKAVSTVQGSNGMFQPYVAGGQSALSMLLNSYGLNGASGNTAAQTAFQASPGYAWQQDQAVDAAARKAASLGMAGSGNTLTAITQLGSNLAKQEYGNWQSGLSGLAGSGLTAAGAISGNNATAAGYQYGGGTGGASILSQLGNLLNTNATGLGTAQANVQSGLGSNLANIQTGLGNSLTSNAWQGANSINGVNLQDASESDKTNSANNGILGKMIWSGLSGLSNAVKL